MNNAFTDDHVEPQSSPRTDDTEEMTPLGTHEHPPVDDLNLSSVHPRCPKCGKPGQFIPPHRIDGSHKVVHADFRCSANHRWVKAFALKR